MRSVSARLRVLQVLIACLVFATSGGRAHEGHDHGAPPPPVSKTIAPRIDASSGDFEVVVVARGDQMVVHLDSFRTNEPIDGAELEIDTPAGVLTPKPIAKEPGTYAVTAPFLAKPGTYDLAITVNARGTVDILAATLTIPESGGSSADGGQKTTGVVNSAIAREVRRQIAGASGDVWVYLVLGFIAGIAAARLPWRRRPKQVQGILLAFAAIALVTAGPVHAESKAGSRGRDIAQRFPDGALFVPKPTQRLLGLRTVFTEDGEHRRTVELPGRVVPSPNASGLVQASVGGRLFPANGGFKSLGTTVKAGDVLAYVRPPLSLADASAQAQQARELDQQISIVSRKVERLRSIERVIARGQLEDAELELKGLTTRRATLDRVKSEPEALVAPVDGVLASANAVAGQMAEPNAVIFQIIDPNRLWIEALSYDAQTLVGGARGQLPDGRTIALEHAGTGFADRNQAIPVHFSITDGSAGLRAGQFLTVLATTADVRRGIAVPREAVLRGSNGQSLVYEHSNAERFVPREVRIEPLDGAHVLIVAGIEAGRRVVTQGAELLGQIR